MFYVARLAVVVNAERVNRKCLDLPHQQRVAEHQRRIFYAFEGVVQYYTAEMYLYIRTCVRTKGEEPKRWCKATVENDRNVRFQIRTYVAVVQYVTVSPYTERFVGKY